MNDIYCYICSFLRDLDKLNFLSVSSDMHILKSKIFFNDYVHINNIFDIWYFDRFTHIITDRLVKYPKCLTHLMLSLNDPDLSALLAQRMQAVDTSINSLCSMQVEKI